MNSWIVLCVALAVALLVAIFEGWAQSSLVRRSTFWSAILVRAGDLVARAKAAEHLVEAAVELRDLAMFTADRNRWVALQDPANQIEHVQVPRLLQSEPDTADRAGGA